MSNSIASVTSESARQKKLLVCMVGLPARGKTYTSKKLARYLNWLGYSCKIFNVGMYRRKGTKRFDDHGFFSATNEKATEIRQLVAEHALDDALNFLNSNGDVAIFDATNVTLERRKMVHDRTIDLNGFSCLFIEFVCDNPDLIKYNIEEVKVCGSDYEGIVKEEAVKDFQRRIEHYKERYDPLGNKEEPDISFVKTIDAGHCFIFNRLKGQMQFRIAHWLMNVKIALPRVIHFCEEKQAVLRSSDHFGSMDLRVWTSAKSPALGIAGEQERWAALDYPVSRELDSLVMEMERTEDDVLVVASSAVLQRLLRYFQDETEDLPMPQHVKVRTLAGGCKVESCSDCCYRE